MADTIAAIATAPAVGAVGILRLSGEDTLSIAKKVFSSKSNFEEKPRVMLYGDMLDASGHVIDRGLAVFMKGPNSYTGEDTVELFCHGSPVVLQELLTSLYHAGARPAKPGEFTKRAFLNGKMDLTQAEAVIDLIDAETTASARNAASQMQGGIGVKITKARDALLDIASEFYAYVDYPDEEIEQQELSSVLKTLAATTRELGDLAQSFDQGRILKDGVQCAIIGRPNAGKSSVLNTLLGFERSIVSDIEGTTRDTIEESVQIGELVLRLIDTAGLRSSEDAIEMIGMERARAAAESAELILSVFDGACPLQGDDFKVIEITRGRNAIALVNKNDLGIGLDMEVLNRAFDGRICIVSARCNEGFESLKQMIADLFKMSGIPCNGEIVTNPRHAAALRKAAEHVGEAFRALQDGFTPDVATADIETAINTLGELTGASASDQVIQRIFERFCVGK